MNKEQVTFKVAKLLKEKGFDLECHHEYHLAAAYPWFHKKKKNFNGKEYSGLINEWYSAPIQQTACDWIEETYGFFIEVSRHIDINGNYHYFYIILDKENKYASSDTGDNSYSSKYDAVDAALEYILTNLI